MNYNVMTIPAVVVDGVVKCKGVVPSEAEATMLKKVMTWRLIGIFFGVIALFIILSGYLFNVIL